VLELARRLLKRFFMVTTDPPEAPLGEKPEIFRASDKHLTYLVAAWGIRQGVLFLSWFVPVVVGAVACFATGLPILGVAIAVVFGGGFVVVCVFDYAAIRIDWEMRWYVLTDRALRIREGVLLTREITLTLANVQELKVMQGPIQRALGIMDLFVDTAGGGGGETGRGSIGGHQGMLRGVDRGGDLKEKIAARVKMRRGAGLGDPDDHHDHDHHDHDHHDHASTATASDFVDALRALRDETHKLREVIR
jgi:membrane protein YdbS with pleckstrin-like domain